MYHTCDHRWARQGSPCYQGHHPRYKPCDPVRWGFRLIKSIYLPAADGLVTLGIGSGEVLRVNVNIRKVHNLERLLAAGDRTTTSWLRGRKLDSPRLRLGELTETNQGTAKQLRSSAPKFHVSDRIGDRRSFQGDCAITDVVILHLFSGVRLCCLYC